MYRFPTLLLVPALFATTAFAKQVTFSDGEFDSANWNQLFSINDDPFWGPPGPGTSSIVASQALSGGNPGSYQRLEFDNRRGDIPTINDMFQIAFDPSTQGEISSVRFTWDATVSSSASDVRKPVVATVQQDDTIYYHISSTGPMYVFVNTGWNPFNTAPLTAADFDTSGPAALGIGSRDGNMPDFSINGSPIKFGYTTIGQVLGGPQLFVQSGIDNFSVGVEVVPEPTSFAFLGIGGLGMSVRRRRRRADR